jgi:hypothetical protein
MVDKREDRDPPTDADGITDDEFNRLIEQSSLGTPGGRSLRKRVTSEQVDAVWERLDNPDLHLARNALADAVPGHRLVTASKPSTSDAIATQLSEPYDTFVHVADGGSADDENRRVLDGWINWLNHFIAGLARITLDGDPIDFAEAACDAWGNAIAESDPPQAPSPASLLLLEVARALIQTAVNAALSHRQITREAVEVSLTDALNGVCQDAKSWLEDGFPSRDEFSRRVQSLRESIQDGQAALEKRQNEDAADDAVAQRNPYGLILGYSDPKVDAAMIFTQVCSLSKAELDRYADAYEQLKRMIDSELLRYVSDMSDALVSVLKETLRDINDRRLSPGDTKAIDSRLKLIRNATITFTSALHSHQTQTYWQAQHQFGEDSDEYRELTKLFHGIYDDSDGYMLLYELRHVLLHISIGAVYSNLSARLDGESTVELNISRYWMARSSGLMDKKYKRDRFEALTSDPSVLDLIRDVQPKFGDLQKAIDKVMYPNVAEDTATVRELIRRFNGRRGLYALQLGPGFTRRLWIPPFGPLAPRVLEFADRYEESNE